MNKGIEILVVDSLTGEIKHRVRESFFDSMPSEYVQKRFEAFGRGIIRLMNASVNNVVQFSFLDLPTCEEGRLWQARSTKTARYVRPTKVDKEQVF